MNNNNNDIAGMREWKELEPNILLKFSACSAFSSFSFHLENLDIKKEPQMRENFLYSFEKKEAEENKKKISEK